MQGANADTRAIQVHDAAYMWEACKLAAVNSPNNCYSPLSLTAHCHWFWLFPGRYAQAASRILPSIFAMLCPTKLAHIFVLQPKVLLLCISRIVHDWPCNPHQQSFLLGCDVLQEKDPLFVRGVGNLQNTNNCARAPETGLRMSGSKLCSCRVGRVLRFHHQDECAEPERGSE